MNTIFRTSTTLLAAAVATALMVGCSSTPIRLAGLDDARSKLAQLQSDPALYNLAPVAIKEAEVAVHAAETAPRKDKALGEHLVFMADRKVDIAWAQAQGRLLEDQREALSQQREAARLESRTREADQAHREADMARADTQVAQHQADMAREQNISAKQQVHSARHGAVVARNEADAARLDSAEANQRADVAQHQANAARNDADRARNQAYGARIDTETAQQQAESARTGAVIARSEADAARSNTEMAQHQAGLARADADSARSEIEAANNSAARARKDAEGARSDAQAAGRQADDLQRQVTELNAKLTDRGLVVTLGDVLFATGAADLKSGDAHNLGKLAAFLNRYPDRDVVIEGHTDNVGSNDANLGLSQRRADAVRTYLLAQGIASTRIVAFGKGEATPVAGNESATGRQQNRRVEVIISNTAVSMR